MAVSVWRNRDFWLVLGGGFVNNVGDWLLAVALPAFVYVETESGGLTATIVIIELAVGVIFGPYGGALVDRWDLRRTVVATNLLQALTLLPLLTVTPDRIWPAFVVAGVQGLLRQVNDPASFALVPRIVEADQLVKANSANTAADAIARLIGSPLGGIAVALGGLTTVVVVDAVTFLTVAVGTDLRPGPDPASLALTGDDRGHAWRGAPRLAGRSAGTRSSSATSPCNPWPRRPSPCSRCCSSPSSIDVLDGDEATVGIIRGMAAFGGLAASILSAAEPRTSIRRCSWRSATPASGSVAFIFVNISGLTTALWLYLVLFGLSGFPNITSQVGAVGTAQRLCPPRCWAACKAWKGPAARPERSSARRRRPAARRGRREAAPQRPGRPVREPAARSPTCSSSVEPRARPG